MARFGDLNVGILAMVLLYFKDDLRTLYNLLLTCRSISEMATKFLYREIFIDFKSPERYRRFLLLLRTLNLPNEVRGPQLASYIQKLDLSWAIGSEAVRDPHAVRFLNSIENVRELGLFIRLDSPARRNHSHDAFEQYHMSFWDISRLRNLRVLNLNMGATIADQSRFLCLTSVDIVRVYDSAPATYGLFSASKLPMREKPLSELALYAQIPHRVLREILSMCAGVKKLFLFEPGTMRNTYHLTCPGVQETDMASSYSPSQFNRALAPLREMLEILDLTTHGTGLDTMGPRLDLHSFPKLRDIHVNSKCFFPPGEPKRDISELLPPSVESLEVRFDPYDGAVKRTINGSPDVDDYQWIIDVVRGTRGRLPRLVRLNVEEEDFLEDCGVCFPVVGFQDWEPPAHVRILIDGGFPAVKVKLRIWGQGE